MRAGGPAGRPSARAEELFTFAFDCAVAAVYRQALLEPMAELEKSLLGVQEILREALEEAPEELSQERAIFEANLALRRLSDSASLCAKFKDYEEHGEKVFWLDKGKTHGEGDPKLVITAYIVDVEKAEEQQLAKEEAARVAQAEKPVARDVTVAVVEVLERVEVEDSESHGVRLPPGAGDLEGQAVEEDGAVREARQGIRRGGQP